MKKRNLFYIDKFGIEFRYKGDSVIYVWPWKRSKFKYRFLSISFEAYFVSLKELEEMWEEYFRATTLCIHGHEDWDDCPVCGH